MTEQKNIKDIPRRLLEFVEAVSNEDLKGREKKKIVLDKVVEEFQLDIDMVLLVSDLIDIIVDISKNRHKIKKKVKTVFNLCC